MVVCSFICENDEESAETSVTTSGCRRIVILHARHVGLFIYHILPLFVKGWAIEMILCY